MAKQIESYNASYPAAFYEIGTVYAFYLKKSSQGIPATDEYVRQFSSVLKEIEARQRSNAIQPVKGGSSEISSGGRLGRSYGVIVSKTAKNIEVMFINDNNGIESFLTKKYAVSNSCETDGVDLMPPSTRTTLSGAQGNRPSVGGITKIKDDNVNGKIGGITKVGKHVSTSANIGGVTRMKDVNSGALDNRQGKVVSKIGGITRMK